MGERLTEMSIVRAADRPPPMASLGDVSDPLVLTRMLSRLAQVARADGWHVELTSDMEGRAGGVTFTARRWLPVSPDLAPAAEPVAAVSPPEPDEVAATPPPPAPTRARTGRAPRVLTPAAAAFAVETQLGLGPASPGELATLLDLPHGSVVTALGLLRDRGVAHRPAGSRVWSLTAEG